MHRLELVYGSGWIAITVAGLAIPLLGVTAAVLTVVFFAGMLVLGCVVTAPRPGRVGATGGSVVAWSSLGPAERARLVRIINLSRVASRPPGARLLVSELDEALAAEPLASWSPLRDQVARVLRRRWWRARWRGEASGVIDLPGLDGPRYFRTLPEG